ncbi:hypothetical protein EMIT093MI4_10585 [Pseudomonas sp. IT-93MI4]
MSVNSAAQVGGGLFTELLLYNLTVLGGAGHRDFLLILWCLFRPHRWQASSHIDLQRSQNLWELACQRWGQL